MGPADPVLGPPGDRCTQAGKEEPLQSPLRSVCFEYTSKLFWSVLPQYGACAK